MAIKKAIQDGIIIQETDGYNKVNLRINEKKKGINKVDIDISKSPIISNNPEVNDNFGIISKYYPKAINDQHEYWDIDEMIEPLLKHGYLNKDGSNLKQAITIFKKDQKLLENELDKIWTNPENIIETKEITWESGNYIINNNDIVEKWDISEFYFKQKLNKKDYDKLDILSKSILTKSNEGSYAILKDGKKIINAANDYGRKTLTKFIENGSIKLNESGVLSESSNKTLKQLSETKILLNDVGLISKYNNELFNNLILFQEKKGLPETGILDELTLYNLENYKKVYTEFKEITNNYENILYNKYNYLTGKNCYFIENQGKIEKWNYDGIISKTSINNDDISSIEQTHFDEVKKFNDKLKDKNIIYFSIGSMNYEDNSLNISLNGTMKKITWKTDKPYEEIISQFKDELNQLPQDATIVLARDELQLGIEKFDKSNPNQMYSDQILNKQYLKSRNG